MDAIDRLTINIETPNINLYNIHFYINKPAVRAWLRWWSPKRGTSPASLGLISEAVCAAKEVAPGVYSGGHRESVRAIKMIRWIWIDLFLQWSKSGWKNSEMNNVFRGMWTTRDVQADALTCCWGSCMSPPIVFINTCRKQQLRANWSKNLRDQL